MAWTDLAVPVVNELSDETDLNALAADINYLHTPNFAEYHHPGTGADYTIAANAVGQDVDATNFNLTITTTGGMVLALCRGELATDDSATSVRLSIVHMEAISYQGRNHFNTFDAEGTTTGFLQPFSILKRFEGLPAGAHAFRLTWGVQGTGGATLKVNVHPYFGVWEG
jgi:hypothetical protein